LHLIYLNISTITSLLDTDDKISDSKGIYKNLRKLFIGSIAKMIKNIKILKEYFNDEKK